MPHTLQEHEQDRSEWYQQDNGERHGHVDTHHSPYLRPDKRSEVQPQADAKNPTNGGRPTARDTKPMTNASDIHTTSPSAIAIHQLRPAEASHYGID